MTSAVTRYCFNDFCVDTARRRLETVRGEPVAIPARAFDVLVVLIERRGAPVSRRQMMETVWHDTVVGENALSQAIAALRRTCGESCILTVPRRGYQFIGQVRDAPEDLQNRPVASAQPPPSSVRQVIRRRLPRWLAGIGAAALAVWSVWLGQHSAPAARDVSGAMVPADPALQRLQYGISLLRSDKEPPAVELAAREFEAALNLDPDLAAARVHLATSYRHLKRLSMDPETESRYAARFAAALQRATDAARGQPEVFELLVEELMQSGSWLQADTMLRERLARDGDFTALLAHGTFLGRVGRLHDAIAELERAHAMSPDDIRAVLRLAEVHAALGHSARAWQLRHGARKLVGYSVVASAPHFWQLLADGDTRAAKASFVDAHVSLNGVDPEFAARMLSGDVPLSDAPGADSFNRVWSVGLRHLDSRVRGAAALHALPESTTGMGTVAGELNLALWAAYFDEPMIGLQALARAADNDPAQVLDILLRPVMASVRRHPGFAQLTRDVGLIEYWETAGYPAELHR